MNRTPPIRMLIFALCIVSCVSAEDRQPEPRTAGTANQAVLDREAEIAQIDAASANIAKSLAGGRSITLAVMDFVNADGKQSALGRYFSEQSARYLTARTNLKVVERAQISRVIQEQHLSASGYISEDSAIAMGSMLGADVVVVGTLTRVGRKISVLMKTVDARTAAVLSTGATELSGAQYLRMYDEILE